MKTRFSPISISISPNTERDDLILALKMLLNPLIWKRGRCLENLDSFFRGFFRDRGRNFFFNSGRSGLFILLKALGIKKGDEVLLQAYTCMAVCEPVLWTGARPVFVDVRDDFNMDPRDLKRKVGSKSKVLIIQHTFGRPADLDKLIEIARASKLFVIEDCAHTLGGVLQGRILGTFADASLFSFGRDKAISSVYGGMIHCRSGVVGRQLAQEYKQLSYPSNLWIVQQLLHPLLVNFLVLPAYYFLNLGKILFVLFQKLHFLSKAVVDVEKQGGRPKYFPAKLPNALACLVLNQVGKIGRFNKHRLEIAKIYAEKLADIYDTGSAGEAVEAGMPLLRFTLLDKEAEDILSAARKQKFVLGDWYRSVVAPQDISPARVMYRKGMCPNAEKLALLSFNLPTHININPEDAFKIASFLKDYKKKKNRK